MATLYKEFRDLRSSPVLATGVVLGQIQLTCASQFRVSLVILEVVGSKFSPGSNRSLMLVVLLFQTDCYRGVSGTIYEYGALTIDGEEYIPFKKYAGKYVLFVNVASY